MEIPQPQTATITLERRGLGVWEMHSGFFDVQVDGRSVGTLPRYGNAISFEVTPGTHVLRVQHDRYSSRDLEIEAFAGGVMAFRTHGAMLPTRWLASLLKPELGISLHRA